MRFALFVLIGIAVLSRFSATACSSSNRFQVNRVVINTTVSYALRTQSLKRFIRVYEAVASGLYASRSEFYWNQTINPTPENKAAYKEFQAYYDEIIGQLGRKSSSMNEIGITDENVLRKHKIIQYKTEEASLPPEKQIRYFEVVEAMKELYKGATVPEYKNPSKRLTYGGGIHERFVNSRDPEELLYYWTKFREVTGDQMRDLFKEFVELKNEAARLNNFKDAEEMNLAPYDYTSGNFREALKQEYYVKLAPIYRQLHAYVRHKLNKDFGDAVVNPRGPIPSNLLGNVWAQGFRSVTHRMFPFPDAQLLDFSEALESQKWTVPQVFKKAEDFFVSLGFDRVPQSFWNDSALEKKNHPNMSCSAYAWNFRNARDFRISMCTNPKSTKDFVTAHHEMGHIMDYLSQKHQPFLYKEAANPGFTEGVGDTISLSVRTPSYLKQQGLVPADYDEENMENQINALFSSAMELIAFMPFSFVVDAYRWDLYAGRHGTTASEANQNFNCHWHKLRWTYQGIVPPVPRMSPRHFDAGSKRHVINDDTYMDYFVAHIYQFQFYKALCQTAGRYQPGKLHQCNYYGSKEAGAKLRKMLSFGRSRNWEKSMEIMTGQTRTDASAMREYFEPLERWLIRYNQKNRVHVGWPERTAASDAKMCRY